MAFSTVGCTADSSTSLATEQVTNELLLSKTTAVSHLTLARDVAQALSDYDFDETNFNNTYSGSGTLSWLNYGNPTDIDYSKLVYVKPDDGVSDNSGSLTDTTDINLYLPPLDSALIEQLIASLIDILQNGFQGLDQCYEKYRWNRARDQATRATTEQVRDIAIQFGARGWVAPCGPEIRMRDKLLEEESRKLADESRDIAFKVYDTAIEIFILALNAALDYFASWARIYAAWIDAQTQNSTLELQQARLEIERLRAQIQIYQVKVSNERARVTTQRELYATDIGVYGSQVQLNGHDSRADQAAFGFESVRRDLSARKERQHNRADAQDNRREILQELTTLRAQMDALTRSVMAQYQSFSFRAQMGSSVTSSNGKDCNTGYTHRESVTL